MSEPIRIALVGAGIYMRDTHAPAYRIQSQHFDVRAVYSRTMEAAQRLASSFGEHVEATTDLDALLMRDDIQAVDIALPIEHMPDAITRALQAGKHVLSEKPAAPDLREARRLAALAAERPEQVWMIAENWRYEAAFVEARKVLSAGEIGIPLFVSWAVSIRMDETNPYYHTAWRRSPQFQGGFLLDVGVHHAAALRHIVGEVTQVAAFTSQMRQDLPPADTLSAALTFESGLLCSYACTFAANAPLAPYLNIFGSDGLLRADRPHLEIVKGQDTERRQMWDVHPKAIVSLLGDFAAVIRREKANDRGSAREAMGDIALMEAILRSAETKRVETVERID